MQGWIELQISTTSLATIIVEQLRNAGIAILNEFEHGGDIYLIDHIDFGNASLIAASDLSSVQVNLSVPHSFGLDEFITISGVRGIVLRQLVTFFITTEQALAAAGPTPQTTWAIELLPTQGITVPVLVALSAAASGGRAMLDARIADIELPESLIDRLPEAIRPLIADLRARLFPGPGMPGPLDSLAPTSIPFDMSAVGALIGRQMPVVNAGLRLDDVDDEREHRITIRIELDDFNQAVYERYLDRFRRDGADGIVESNLRLLRRLSDQRRTMWAGFYSTPSVDRLRSASDASRQWAVVISSALITDVIRGQVERTVTPTSSFRSRVGFSPSVSWSPTNGRARIAIHLEGAVADACTCGWSRTDINTAVDLTFTFSLPRRNALALDVHLDWFADFFGTACCVLTAALVWPAVGAIELEAGRIDGWAYVGGLALGPLGVLVVGIVAAATAGPGGRIAFSAGAISLVRSDDHNLHGEAELAGRLHFDHFPDLAVTAVEGHPDALVIAGQLGEIVAQLPARLDCDEPRPFAWTVRRPCESAYVADIATFGLTNIGGRRSLHLKEVSIRGDTSRFYDGALTWRLHELPPTVIWQPGRRIITLEVTRSWMLRWMRDHETESIPPARVLVRTDRGARLLTMPGPALMGEQEATEMFDSAQLGCPGSRADFFTGGPGKGRFKIIDVLGDPDPDLQWRLLLAFSGHGFAEGERIAIIDRDETEVAAVFITMEGALRLSTLAEIKALGGAQIARTGIVKTELLKAAPYTDGYQAPQTVAKQELIVRALTLAVRGEIKAPGKLLDHRLGSWGGSEVLFVTGTEGLRTVRLDPAGFGKLVAEVEATGLRGAVALDQDLYAFGDRGFAKVTADGRLEIREEKPVKDVLVRDGALLILTEQGLMGWNGTALESAPKELPQLETGFERFATAGGVLAVYGPAGLLRLGSKEMSGDMLKLPVEMIRPLLTDPGRVVVRIDGREAVIDLTDNQAPRVVVELDTKLGESWQARAAGAGGIIALASEDGVTIELLRRQDVIEKERVLMA